MPDEIIPADLVAAATKQTGEPAHRGDAIASPCSWGSERSVVALAPLAPVALALVDLLVAPQVRGQCVELRAQATRFVGLAELPFPFDELLACLVVFVLVELLHHLLPVLGGFLL